MLKITFQENPNPKGKLALMFFQESSLRLSVDLLKILCYLQCLYNLHVQSHAPTSVHNLKIPGADSHSKI